MQISVLGMGRMGRAVAGRVLDGGHQLTVWNRTRGRAPELVGRGVAVAGSAAEAAAGADVVVTSLADDAAVGAVLLPGGQPLETASGGVVVEASTVSPALTRRLSGAFAGRYVAAPVLGAPQAVTDGAATYAVAGPGALVDGLQPLWASLGDHLVRCGEDPVRASVVKLVNNYLLLSDLGVLAEAVTLAQSAGLDDDTVVRILGASPQVAPALRNRLGALVSSTDHAGWFTPGQGAKDLGLALDLARSHDVDLPAGTLFADRYEQAASTWGDADITAVVELLRCR